MDICRRRWELSAERRRQADGHWRLPSGALPAVGGGVFPEVQRAGDHAACCGQTVDRDAHGILAAYGLCADDARGLYGLSQPAYRGPPELVPYRKDVARYSMRQVLYGLPETLAAQYRGDRAAA